MDWTTHGRWRPLSGTAAALGLAIALTPRFASAELVFDETVAEQAVDREATRQVIEVTEKAGVTRAAPLEAVETIEPLEFGVVPVQNLSRTELLRRERMRQELRNEDSLQERLEALRLRDEQSRAELLGTPAPDEGIASLEPIPPSSVEWVEAPATGVASERDVQSQQAGSLAVEARSGSVADDPDRSSVLLVPRGGLSNFQSAGGVEISGRYAVGLGLDIGASENVIFQVGYLFNEYGIAVPGYAGVYGNPEILAFKQNVADVGLKFYLLSSSAKVRPYVAGGAGYSKGYLNYDQRSTNYWSGIGNPLPADYEISSYLGILSTGVDVRLSRSFSVGAMFRYHTVLASRETSPLDSRGFYNPFYPVAPLNAFVDPVRRTAGTSMSRTAFYSILTGVSFMF